MAVEPRWVYYAQLKFLLEVDIPTTEIQSSLDNPTEDELDEVGMTCMSLAAY